MSPDRSSRRACLPGLKAMLLLAGLVGALVGGCGDAGKGSWFGKNMNAAEQRWNQVRSDVRVGLAEDALREGNYAEASAQINTVQANAPETPGIQLLKARILVARGDFAAAEPILRNLAVSNQCSAEGLYLLGTVLQQSGRLEEAEEHYRAASRLEPANSEYALAVSECLLSLDRAEDALLWLESLPRLADASGESAGYHRLLARAALMSGRVERASLEFDHALQLGADDAWTVSSAADTFMELGDYRQALSLLEPLIRERGHRDPSLKMSLARCYLETGQPRKARTVLAVLVRDEPDPYAWLMLAQASAACGDVKAAIRNAGRAIEIDDDNVLAYQTLAGLALKDGDLRLATSVAEESLRLAPDDALSRCVLAEACRRDGNLERAVRLWEHALQLDPACEEARLSLLRHKPAP